MPRSSITLDLRGHLERSLGCRINDPCDLSSSPDSIDLTGLHIIGDGPATHHCDLYWLKPESWKPSEHWRDILRYELRQHPLIAKTLTFRDSLTVSAECYDHLLQGLSRFPDVIHSDDRIPFFVIEFKLAERHKVTVFISCDRASIVSDNALRATGPLSTGPPSAGPPSQDGNCPQP